MLRASSHGKIHEFPSIVSRIKYGRKNDEKNITNEHVKNNREVRELLGKSGIKPEELPPEEDIKKLQRRVKSNEKLIEKTTNKFKNITDNNN